jgi:ATP-dependent DNA helicase RecG
MVSVIEISSEEATKVLNSQESHFLDLKSKDIKPASLTKTISAFSNAEGGELFIGIEDEPRIWNGFANQELANGHIQAFEGLFPLGDGYSYCFLSCKSHLGLVLKIDVQKNRAIKKASNDTVYIRRSSQNLSITEDDALHRLARNKGLISFETETISIEKAVIENSANIINFMLEVVPAAEPESWLKKQRLIINELPTVAGVLLFAEEPQAIIPKHCGLKIYQYATKEDEGTREALLFDPITIEGCIYDSIKEAVIKTVQLIEKIRIMTPDGLKNAEYPVEALHEIVTNAVLHRDYSIADDIHIRIYDNRIEIQSPGTLPAHVTPENILHERFARNGVIVRLINKFPDPPNKDVGEGLNTAFNSMRAMRLKAPEILQKGGSVLVILRHESLGTPQELIMQYLENHETITNRDAREICNVQSENAMKHILKRMVEAAMIEVIPGQTIFQTSYKKPANKG